MIEPSIKSSLLNRRTLIRAALGGGAVAWAGAGAWSRLHAGERPRLALVMLQGGADGLSLAPPRRDGRYLELRGPLTISAPLPFSPDFGLHPSLSNLAAMARNGQVRLAPAAASPGRSRSHGSETSLLLTGAADAHGPMTGWLNRAVAALAPKGVLPAVSLEAAASEALLGPALFGAWAPGAPTLGGALADSLRSLYASDPQLKALLATTERVQAETAPLADGLGGSPLQVRSGVVGRLFAKDDGPVAAFLTAEGYDTHQDQGAERGALADRLRDLDLALAALRKEAGEAWAKTAVLVVTEFGRTAFANGGGGTDHGVASTALLLGGAVKRGGPLGDWAGLSARALHEGRELAPGLDVRRLFKGVLAEHWGLSRAVLQTDVFPGSSKAQPISGLVG